MKESYVKALLLQLDFELKKLPKDVIETVFIGGGTPSTLNSDYFKQIFKVLNPYLNNVKEITCEVNPNSTTKQWLKDIYNLGVNRVSFGVQSFDDDKLKFLGRNHNSSSAIKIIEEAFEVGFENINCDIIYDTILDTKKLLQNDLNIIKELPINHLSAYSLTLEEGTKFYQRSDVKIDDEDMAIFLFDSLEKLGFKQYEISNFAKGENSKSKHNLGYWKYKQYIGVGAGAVGCKENKRLYNFKDINMYIQNPTTYDYTEQLSSDDIIVEKVLLGLRCEVGFDKNLLNKTALQKAYNLEKLGKIVLKEDNRFYSSSFLLADELALYIL